MRQHLAVGVLCLLVCASAFAQRTHIDYDHNADFAAFHTYGWEPSPEPGKGEWNQRIIDAVDKQLQAKGLIKVDSNPDMWVIYSRTVKEQVAAFKGGYVPGPGWGTGFAGVPAEATTFEQGTLVVELGDPKTKQILWRGSVSKTLTDNDNKNLKNLDNAVGKLFHDYPPKEKK
jgi:hypothetical protein